ncbi:hypothetical protein I3B83_20305, partial [Mycobacterium tuberculosis]|nr:hypothetical protein [Mycobacterium tuberculosis]MCN4351772.1 hypothetical protein [Mycobacterium tuberculosis]
DITIPGIPLSLNALGGVGPITVPGVPISRIPLTINIRIPVNITLNELPFNVAGIFTGYIGPIPLSTFVLGVTLAGGTLESGIQGFSVNPFGLNIPLSGATNAVTIPGFAINPFGLNVPLSGGTSPVTIPGFAINPFGLDVPLSGGTNAVTL